MNCLHPNYYCTNFFFVLSWYELVAAVLTPRCFDCCLRTTYYCSIGTDFVWIYFVVALQHFDVSEFGFDLVKEIPRSHQPGGATRRAKGQQLGQRPRFQAIGLQDRTLSSSMSCFNELLQAKDINPCLMRSQCLSETYLMLRSVTILI
jgi:hypothetical protein